MHVKLTYHTDGTIDLNASAQSMTGGKVSRLLGLLTKLGVTVTVERLTPSGVPIQDPEILK